jgi:hypothetical protein
MLKRMVAKDGVEPTVESEPGAQIKRILPKNPFYVRVAGDPLVGKR